VYEESILVVEDNAYKRANPPERYAPYRGMCGCRTKADITVKEEYFQIHHIVKNEGKLHELCERCLKHRNMVANEDNKIIKLPNGGTLIMSIDPESLVTVLYRLDYGALAEIGVVEDATSTADAVSKALKIWTK